MLGAGRWTAGICALALASGCSNDATGPRSISVTVTVCSLGESKICPATTVLPFRALEVTAHVVPVNVAVEQVTIQTTGVLLGGRTFVADPPRRGPGVAFDTLVTPAELGAITITATARGGGVSGTSAPVVVHVADAEPPVVEAVTVSPTDSVEPGDELVVSVTARDNAFVNHIIAQARGAFSAVESLYTVSEGGTFELTFHVPETAPVGGVASFDVHAIDIAGLTSNVVTASGPVLRDLTAPAVTGADVDRTLGDVLVPEDTFRVTISAADNHKLAWVGYRVGEPVIAQDSVAVTDAGGSYVVTSPVTASWIGTPLVQPFARDSSGNVAAATFFLQLRVVDAVRRPSRRNPEVVTVIDLAYDAKREALYLFGSLGLVALPLATLEYAPLPLPFDFGSIFDLTPSNDSLVMPFGYTLGIVDLTQSPPSVDTVPLVYDTLLGTASLIAVTASSKALMVVSPGTVTAALLAHDLSTGQTETRTDVGAGGTIMSHATLVPSIDRRRVALFWGSPGGETQEGQVYQVATNGFTALRSSGVHFAGETAQSADSAGRRFLLGGALHGPDLAPLGTFDYPSNPDFPGSLVVSTITPDGQHAYFSQSLEQTVLIVKVRLADGVVVERILAPAAASQLLVTPDGTTLIGIAGVDGVFLIDLR